MTLYLVMFDCFIELGLWICQVLIKFLGVPFDLWEDVLQKKIYKLGVIVKVDLIHRHVVFEIRHPPVN
jgi:hypothetical protein